MNGSIESYLNKSKKNLNTIIECLEKNIEFLDNDLWNEYSTIKNTMESIVEIYFDKYYLYSSNDFNKINNYIKFNNKINRKLKTILLAIIDYYEITKEENIIKDKESSILYMTILIYIALVLYEKNINNIDTPKKIEKTINNILDNFEKIRFRREKDLVVLIQDIKNIIINNNEFNNALDKLNTEASYNIYMSINKDNDYYKVIYNYKINELDNYENKDISIVNDKMNITKKFTKISYDLACFTAFKLLKKGLNYKLLFPITKNDLMERDMFHYINNNNKDINRRIKFLINYEEIKNDYEFINFINEQDINVFIEMNDSNETNNYNMFMGLNKIIVPEEFIGINEKYLEIWKDMKIEFIIKNLGQRLTESRLIGK